MDIDITKLSKQELRRLNRLICDRVKYLNRQETLQHLSRFEIGDIVTMQNGGSFEEGVIIRINKKTVSIVEFPNEDQWYMSPRLVNKQEKPSKAIVTFRDKMSPFTPSRFKSRMFWEE